MNKVLLLAGLAALLAIPSPSVCVHPGAGPRRAVSLDRVGKAQEEVTRRFAWAVEHLRRLSPDGPYDSGLPACRGRERRRIRGEFPAALAGKTVAVAPEGRMPEADFRVASSAPKILEIHADGLADPALCERLGVRCAPTRVRIVSESEVELVENP